MIKREHIDINTKVSLLSLYSAIPRQEHLEATLHLMGYLKLRLNFRLVFDPSYPSIEHSELWDCNWTGFYDDAVETIPPNAPLP